MNILVGVCGGIAAYKTAYLVRRFVKAGHGVKIVMTPDAARFVTPLTFMTLSHNRVYTAMFSDPLEYDYAHIELGQWADTMVIAPATANTIAKLAHGLADNLLTATVLAWPDNKPLFIAPAMNTRMFAKEATRSNLECIGRTAAIIGPVAGPLACGETGIGAMADPETIYQQVTGNVNSKEGADNDV